MRYFVFGNNGEIYGPADIPTLNQWIAEGRLTPTSMIQEEFGGARFAASMLRELAFARPGETAYPRNPYAQPNYDRGAQDVKMAWILGAVGLVCCALASPFGIYYAAVGKKKGHPSAIGAMVFCIIVTVLNIGAWFLLQAMGGMEGIMRGLRF